MDVNSPCARNDCSYSTTGICLEGHSSPESCSFIGMDDSHLVDLDGYEGDENEEEVIDEILLNNDFISLSSGETLTIPDVDHFLLSKPAKFVAIIGELDSGKTTLICSLYECFLKGKFSGYSFKGSRTLIGFEKRAHHSRIDSGRVMPDTLRTSFFDGLRYFHLSLVKEETENVKPEYFDLMLSDRAGEQYQQARSNSENIKELIEIKKSDYIVLLLDGAKLADPFQRHSAMQAVRRTLWAFLDADALSSTSKVQVVTTKLDLLSEIPQKEIFDELIQEFKSSLISDLGPRLGELSFSEVSARDPSAQYPLASGLDNLVKEWCSAKPITVRKEIKYQKFVSEFDRLFLRTIMD
ncbi:TRAFAC clade GTPase domain-containing protein [Klebsiella pasteurii]|uniref:TRAFAC clade GTPase domain-containing protein n=1 Tax=Klebsiella pasteurii TaxID=2587529 RepID=UPI003B429074